MIYTIPEYKIKPLIKKLDAINARAVGVANPITYTISQPYEKVFSDGIGNIKKAFTCSMVDLDLTNSFLSVNGWAFLAIIEHSRNGNIIMKKLYDVEIPEKYRTSGSHCDHCNTDRYRKNTYLVYNENTKEIFQVGSTCINKYLGFDASLLVSHATIIEKINAMLDDSKEHDRMFHRGQEIITLNIFMKLCLALIDNYGYISAKKVYNGDANTATGHDAFNLYYNKDNALFEQSNHTKYAETLCDIYDWAYDLEDTSDYIHNLKTILHNGYVTYKTATTAASMAGVYLMNLNKKNMEPVISTSKHFGTPKERLDVDMTLKSIAAFDGRWGSCNVYTFITNDGNIATWFTNNANLTEGKQYIGKATIKAHTEFKGTQQTTITRCSLTEY